MTKSQLEKAREIISSVKREMEKPRLTESVRNGESGLAALADQMAWGGADRGRKIDIAPGD